MGNVSCRNIYPFFRSKGPFRNLLRMLAEPLQSDDNWTNSFRKVLAALNGEHDAHHARLRRIESRELKVAVHPERKLLHYISRLLKCVQPLSTPNYKDEEMFELFKTLDSVSSNIDVLDSDDETERKASGDAASRAPTRIEKLKRKIALTRDEIYQAQSNVAASITGFTVDQKAYELGSQIPDFISRFKNLRHLDLRGIKPENGEFKGLNFLPKSVQILDIRGNDLTSIPSGPLEHVEYCRMVEGNSLEDLGGSFPALLLWYQDLNGVHSALTKGSRDLSQELKATSVDLSGKAVSRFPRDLGMLSTLRKLRMDRNTLKEFPKFLGRLKNLEFLNLASNGIRRIDSGILQELTSLKVLNLRHNSIEELENSLENFLHVNIMIGANPIASTNGSMKLLRFWMTQHGVLDEKKNTTSFRMSKALHVLPKEFVNLDFNCIDGALNPVSELVWKKFANFQSLRILNLEGSLRDVVYHVDRLSLPSLERLILRKNTIKKLSNWHLPALTHLDVSFNMISSMSSCHLPNLKSAILCSNQLTVEPGFLEKSPDLKKLDLSQNNIKRLKLTCVLPSLEDLDLNKNSLASFPKCTLDRSRMPALRTVNVARNRISVLPKCLAEVKGCAYKYLPNPIVSLGGEQNLANFLIHCGVSRVQAENHSELKSLDLSDKGLAGIPVELEKLSSLNCLNVSGISSVKKFLKLQTESLIQLTAQGCELGPHFPYDNEWKRLVVLDAANNNFTRIPIVSAGTLRVLRLSGCHMQDIKGIEAYRNLEELDISNNHLSQVYEGFGGLTNLKKLSWEKNFISDFPRSVWLIIQKLRDSDPLFEPPNHFSGLLTWQDWEYEAFH
eukprot:jgi/Bigna1/132612/aug1.18_g7320